MQSKTYSEHVYWTKRLSSRSSKSTSFNRMLASDMLADSSQLHKACCTCMQDIVMREAMVMRQQRHPNVLPLLAAFLAEAVLWMVMPYVAGGSAIHILNKRLHGVSCPQGLFCVHQSPHCLQITFAHLACMFSGFLCITNQP